MARKWWKSGGVLFWTDFAGFVLMLAMVGTGAILKWVLPHGGGGRGMGRRAGEAMWMGLDRHTWGEVHFYVSIALVVVVAIHLLSHFGWIRTSVPKYFGLARGHVAAATD
jgi:hypothetical protein